MLILIKCIIAKEAELCLLIKITILTIFHCTFFTREKTTKHISFLAFIPRKREEARFSSSEFGLLML